MTKNIKPKSRVVSILSKLSHELKKPIHGVKGISSYLLENWDSLSNSEKKKYLSISCRNKRKSHLSLKLYPNKPKRQGCNRVLFRTN